MVLKSEIETSLKHQQQYWKSKRVGVKRDIVKNIKLTNHFVLIITGVRRCGKSTLMHQLSRLHKKKSIWLNFEDSRIFGFELKDFIKFDDIVDNKISTYFFDEIQNVKNWEVYIREVHDRGKTICITGSNASMLSKELGTKLTGRNIQIELFPFSFKEYCSFFKLKPTQKHLINYLDDGGFPDYLKTKQKEYLQQLFRDIVYRDIIVRHSIRHANVLIELALYLISNSSKIYSLNNLRKIFSIGSTNSVANYVKWLEESYLFFSVPKFSWSLKSVAINPKKIYTIDTAFAQANSLSFTNDKGRLFENLIFLALRRNYKDIYYYSEKGECDFVIKNGRQIILAVQVCYNLNADNQDREINGLTDALNYFNLPNGTIVTLNQDDELEVEGKKISLVPAHKWLKTLDI